MKPNIVLIILVNLSGTLVAYQLLKSDNQNATIRDSASTANSTEARSSNSSAETPGSDWKYTVESGDELIKDRMISNRIALTSYANSLGFHIRKNSAGNYSVQTAPGILPDLMHDLDIFHSPSRDCSEFDTTKATYLPDSIILWNDDDDRVAVLTYCIDASSGRVQYNNGASRKMTRIEDGTEESATLAAQPAANKKDRFGSSENALLFLLDQVHRGSIRLTPQARNFGFHEGMSMTGLPPGAAGERCDAKGCIAAACPTPSDFGETIIFEDADGRPHSFGYCIDRYSGEINAFNDDAFSFTMKADHSQWKPN